MSNKALKIIFWTATILFSLLMAFSAFSYLTSDEMRQAFAHLGFPGYFRVELAIAKIAGIAVLFLPAQARLKEWAYAGFSFTLISALIAHLSVGDALQVWIAPLIAGAILAASYLTCRKLSGSNLTASADEATTIFESSSASTAGAITGR